MNDEYKIEGCPAGKNPCLALKWISGSPAVFVNSIPVITHTSPGYCHDGSGYGIQSPPVVISYQTTHTDGEG